MRATSLPNPVQRPKGRCRTVGKLKWRTKQDAKAAMLNLGGKGSVYRCRHCWRWHLTRQDEAEA